MGIKLISYFKKFDSDSLVLSLDSLSLFLSGSKIENRVDVGFWPINSITIMRNRFDSLKKLFSAFADSISPVIVILDENRSLPPVDA